VTLIEFKLTTLPVLCMIPFGLFGKTAFAAERVPATSSHRVSRSWFSPYRRHWFDLVLAIHRGIRRNQPTIEDAMSWSWRHVLLGARIFALGSPTALCRAVRTRAGAAVGTGLAAGGVVAAGVAGAGLAAGTAGGVLAAAARGSARSPLLLQTVSAR